MGRGSIWDVPLQPSNFNVTLAVLGGFVSLFGLVSFLVKENFYLSEALISLLVGVGLGPNGANWLRPREYAECFWEGVSASECNGNIDGVTMAFSRLVLGVQLVLAGVQLPSRYLWAERRSLLLLIGPGMAAMWLATSGLVWVIVRPPSVLHALAVGACVTPTDPVLSAVIVKGKFADQNIPRELQHLVTAESGTNDGLGYPFLFFALYLIKFVGAVDGGGGGSGGIGDAVGLWFAFTWAYTIVLGVAYGAVVGLVGKSLLHWAERRNYVDRESFLVFAISLALFVVGTCGMLGTDDVLACFIAGNTFTWDDWFRLQTKDDSLQPTVDMLLNVTVFLWYGASLPWGSFAENGVPGLSVGRLVALGALVLFLRRLPWVFAMRKWVHQMEGVRHALFVGFFGPIGVSAVFYIFIAVDFIRDHLSDEKGVPRSDVVHLAETIRVVVWFLVVCSVIVHGLTIPIGRLGYLAPRFGRVLGSGGRSLSNERLVSAHQRKVSGLRKWLGRKTDSVDSGIVTHDFLDWEAAGGGSGISTPCRSQTAVSSQRVEATAHV
ncbi:hypothetical protein CP533_5936 [Ophiocordyceps camponoti-saundersi (nom. inval.)]|nr:hypothetical protein CP533_5936 [Ophiocordyceps camponoti-saundersi (nom. inval.)]